MVRKPEYMRLRRMALLVLFSALLFGLVQGQESKCGKNPDPLYDRDKVLTKFVKAMKHIPEGQFYNRRVKDSKPRGFNVYDLADTSNFARGIAKDKCVDFIDRHVYHFSPLLYEDSESFIAILNKGKISIFPRVNCGDAAAKLGRVKRYVQKTLRDEPGLQDILTRVSFYRRYGAWAFLPEPLHDCDPKYPIPSSEYAGKSRYFYIQDWSVIANKYLPEGFTGYDGNLRVEREIADDIYIRDLSDLSNKQDSVVSPISLHEGHVYQFGYIDLPYSLTHFVVLFGGKPHYFEAIECGSDKENLGRLLSFVNQNLDGAKKRKVKSRIKEYKKFRIATPFGGSTEPKWVCKKRG